MTSIFLALLTSTVFALERPAPMPEPLEPRPLALPDPQIGQLSNGIEVRVAPNHEVPLFQIRMALAVGNYADPQGAEGLSRLTFDMLDEGAGDRDAAAIAAEMKRLAGQVSASDGRDSASISASGITRSLEGILDVWADVVRRPTFPEDKWDIVLQRTVANLQLADENPGAIASNVWHHLVWGDGYIGRHATVDSVQSLSLSDASEFYGQYVTPEHAIILVGGDVTLDQVLPLLEARLGDWSVEGGLDAPVEATPRTIEAETIYLVDKPGAAQSVIRSGTTVGTLESSDHFDLLVGNRMFGGNFTGRVNMNLREDKGYTYGARCGVSTRHGPGQFGCGGNFRTDVTGLSLAELRREFNEVIGERPLTDEEVATARDNLAYGWPGAFETTGTLLDLEFEIWRYGKSEDWASDYIPNVRAVTTEQANAALKKWLVPERTFWLVVGDKSVILEGLQASGLPIVELNRNGEEI